jgi:hypothetical protein
MVDVQGLADGSLVAVGEDAAGHFASWLSSDGLSWQRSAPGLYVGPPVSTTNAPLMLATDGRLMVAVSGDSRDWISPPITHGLGPATVTLALAGLASLPATVTDGTCSSDDNGTGDTLVATTEVQLSDPNPLTASVMVTATGGVTSMYFSSDRFSAGVGGSPPNDLSRVTVGADSTARNGSVAFHDLVADGGAAGDATLSGTLGWTCRAWTR